MKELHTDPIPEQPAQAETEPEVDDINGCHSCGEDDAPPNECPKSRRGCGHHCNCSWTQDACCWCGIEFLGDGETRQGEVREP